MILRELLQESINRILREQITPAVLQSAEAGEWNLLLHGVLNDGGFTRALATEDFGGVGASWSDVFPIVQACGRYALPLPVPETLVATWLLDRSGIQIPEGSLTIAEADAGTTLSRAGNEWRLQGKLSGVAWGRAVDFVVTSVAFDGVERIVLLNRKTTTVTPDQNIAREARDTLTLANIKVDAVAPLPDGVCVDPIRLYGALMRAGQLAGAMERIVEHCVQYCNDRIQFGKPIGKFQAIQQQLAVLASQAAAVTVGAEYAFAMAAQGQPEFATVCAKQRASETAGTAAAIAHAVHGAIGFTYEHSLHYLTRRLWSWRSEFGTHAYWAERLGREMCKGSAADVWARITAQHIQYTE